MAILLTILAFVSWGLALFGWIVNRKRDKRGKAANAVRLPKRWVYERYYPLPLVVGFILITLALLAK